jgi:hypothetical protein
MTKDDDYGTDYRSRGLGKGHTAMSCLILCYFVDCCKGWIMYVSTPLYLLEPRYPFDRWT